MAITLQTHIEALQTRSCKFYGLQDFSFPPPTIFPSPTSKNPFIFAEIYIETGIM